MPKGIRPKCELIISLCTNKPFPPCSSIPSLSWLIQLAAKFLDDLFKAILSIRDDKPPVAVKYFFDFLEEQAEKRGITDPDTMHIWKTNRFGREDLFFPSFLLKGAAAAKPWCPTINHQGAKSRTNEGHEKQGGAER